MADEAQRQQLYEWLERYKASSVTSIPSCSASSSTAETSGDGAKNEFILALEEKAKQATVLAVAVYVRVQDANAALRSEEGTIVSEIIDQYRASFKREFILIETCCSALRTGALFPMEFNNFYMSVTGETACNNNSNNNNSSNNNNGQIVDMDNPSTLPLNCMLLSILLLHSFHSKHLRTLSRFLLLSQYSSIYLQSMSYMAAATLARPQVKLGLAKVGLTGQVAGV